MNLQRDRELDIGIVYETFDRYEPRPGAPVDANVEYEPESTIQVLEEAIGRLGHQPIRVGSPEDFWARGVRNDSAGRLDVVLNIAEGHGSRNREAWAPVLLEMAGVPFLGSDALTLSTTLDKAWANRAVAAAGIAVAPQCVLAGAEEAANARLPCEFPLFVKPRWEGTAKGIRRSSRVEGRSELIREVDRIARDYDQPALVEAFVAGPEYTVTVVGHQPPRALPVVQRALDPASGIGWHVLNDEEAAPSVPGTLTPALEARLASLGQAVFELFECRDFARADFRLDSLGNPIFLEINPLPTFGLDGTFAILAELEGRTLDALLAEVIEMGLVRLGLVSPRPGSKGVRHPNDS